VECDYISHWESLIGETLQLLSSNVPDMEIIMMRNPTDKFHTGSLVESSRPDMLCWLGSALVIRGEEKAAERDLIEAEHELYDKFNTWNPLFYGDSPFIFGYATGGMRIKIFLMRNSPSFLCRENLFTDPVNTMTTEGRYRVFITGSQYLSPFTICAQILSRPNNTTVS